MHLIKHVRKVLVGEDCAVFIVDLMDVNYSLPQQPFSQVAHPRHKRPIAETVRSFDLLGEFHAAVYKTGVITQLIVIGPHGIAQINFCPNSWKRASAQRGGQRHGRVKTSVPSQGRTGGRKYLLRQAS